MSWTTHCARDLLILDFFSLLQEAEFHVIYDNKGLVGSGNIMGARHDPGVRID